MPHVSYFWDEIEDNVVEEFDGDAGATIASYTTEPTLYGSALSQNRSGQKRHYQFDGQGNTTELTDASGAVTDTRRYTAFGEPTVSTGSTPTPFGFGGRWGYHSSVSTTRLSIRRRNLSLANMRWDSRDPDNTVYCSESSYVYSANRPLVRIDPSGLKTTLIDPKGYFQYKFNSADRFGQMRLCVEITRVKCALCACRVDSLEGDPFSGVFGVPYFFGPVDFDATIEGFLFVYDFDDEKLRRPIVGHEYVHWLQVKQLVEQQSARVQQWLELKVNCSYLALDQCESDANGIGKMLLEIVGGTGGHLGDMGPYAFPGQIAVTSVAGFQPGPVGVPLFGEPGQVQVVIPKLSNLGLYVFGAPPLGMDPARPNRVCLELPRPRMD